MRILYTAHSYPPDVSGVAEVVSQLARRLAMRGHEVHVATELRAGNASCEVLDKVHVHRFAARGNSVTGMHGALPEYAAFVRGSPWDVVAMHCAQTWTTDALLPYLSALQAARIMVFHGVSAFGNPVYRAYFRGLAEALHSVEGVVSLSGLVEDASLCKIFALPPPTVIPNGADVEAWGNRGPAIREKWRIGDRPWILTVSNHNPLKGHGQFIRLARELRREEPNLAATIVGGNYPAAKYDLGRFGIKGGCWYRCRVQSRLQRVVDLRRGAARQDVMAAVQEADILICTSYWEASPLSIVESMAAGTPWISFDVGCVRENAGGMVVGSLDEMRAAALGLLRSRAARQRLGAEGRARALARHDWNSVVTQHENLYRRVRQGAAA